MYDEVTKESESANEKLIAHDAKIVELARENEVSKAQIVAHEAKIVAHEAKIVALEAEIFALDKENQASKAKTDKTVTELATAKQQIDELKTILLEVQQRLREIEPKCAIDGCDERCAKVNLCKTHVTSHMHLIKIN